MDYPVRDGAGTVILDGASSGPRTPAAVYNAGTFTAINTDLLSGLLNGWVDVSDCLELAVQVVTSAGISAGAIIFEQTNDPAFAAINVPVTEANVPGGAQLTGAQTLTANASRMFLVPILARFVRCRISTGVTGGTVRAFAMGREFDAEMRGAPATGPAAHDSPIAGNPVRVAGRALNAMFTTVGLGDTVDLVTTLSGALITRPFAIPEADWSFASPAGGVVNTTDVVLAAAAGGSLRRYITSMQISNANATATEVVLKDGSTIIWRGHLPANAPGRDIEFATPLKTSGNAALNFACITTGAQVYVSAQGYTAI